MMRLGPLRCSRSSRRLLLLPVLSALALGGCGQWEAYDETPPTSGGTLLINTLTGTPRLDHLGLSGLMSHVVSFMPISQNVLVDYDRITTSEEAKHLLSIYLATLATVNPSDLESAAERLAYWVNGYNATVIQGVLLRYQGLPTFKVTDLAFFDQPGSSFGGLPLTLNQVEHGVARGRFDHESLRSIPATSQEQIRRWHQELWPQGTVDPRIHAMFNCAALSCPNLPAFAPFVYVAKQLEQQMHSATEAWLNNPAKGAGPQGISRIFEWYADDFVASHGSVEAFIKTHRGDGLTNVNSSRFLTYDWTLNISAP